ETIAGNTPDERSDVYSFGVVLYQMATGKLPFDGPTTVAILHAILNQSPVAPRAHRPELSAALEAVLLRALARDRAARPASALELASELERAAGASSAGGRPVIRSLAVLPLANLSGDPTQEFFADGMTEALIADLAKFKDLRVISRTSALRYKHTTKS